MANDYISRAAAIDAVDVGNLHRGIVNALQEIISDIPAADVRPVARGEWFEPDDDYGYLVCSVCEERSPNDERWSFCPNCGADMRRWHNG